MIDLNNLMIRLQGQISSQWYQFGLVLGVPKEIMGQWSHQSETEHLAEVLDYWLKHHPHQPTWKEITDAQKKIEELEKNYRAEDCKYIY